MAVYADLTMLGGRHRRRTWAANRLVDLHPIADRLVCATIYDGNSGWPSVIRDCGCGHQLWVSTAMLELVDTWRVIAICLGCHLSDRKPMELHPAVMPSLYLAGCSADAWRTVATLNGLDVPNDRYPVPVDESVSVRPPNHARSTIGDNSTAT